MRKEVLGMAQQKQNRPGNTFSRNCLVLECSFNISIETNLCSHPVKIKYFESLAYY